MSTYHCSVKIISRSNGRSSVGSAAYRAGEKIKNERDGITHDYTKKGGVVYSEIILPENAPPSYSDRAILWNAVEQSETRINSQTAREIEVALPRETSYKEQAEMLRKYIQENFVSRGMCADFSIHHKDEGSNNPHAHIMLTTREVTPDGFTSKNRDWNKRENVEAWRESWARLYNQQMQNKSLPDRVDHRSYKRRGINKEPTIHRGPAAHRMEQRGIRTDRGNINRGIEERNRKFVIDITELREDVNALTAEHRSLVPYGREAFAAYGIEIPMLHKERPAPERETGRTAPRSGLDGKQAKRERKTRLRGKMGGIASVSLPFGKRVALELRRCHRIDNLRGMAAALFAIRRENIKSYGDFDRRIEECKAEIMKLNREIEPLNKEYERIAETIGPLETYKKYLPYRKEIESAGIFGRKKLEQKYKLEMQGLKGSEERLRRMGTDPKTVTLEQQRERLDSVREARQELYNRRSAASQKWTDMEKSQKMMKQLFVDRGIDYSRSKGRSREMDLGR